MKWFALDVAAVLAFVAIGRDSHDEAATFGAFVETAAPFVIGVAVAWLVVRAWRAPLAATTVIGVTVATAAVGLVIRRLVFDDGIAWPFPLVAAGFLGLLFFVWRSVAVRWSGRTRTV